MGDQVIEPKVNRSSLYLLFTGEKKVDEIIRNQSSILIIDIECLNRYFHSERDSSILFVCLI